MRKLAIFLMSAVLLVLLLPKQQTSAAGLNDEWNKMIDQGVIIKNEKGVYPTSTGTITREEFATYISKALKLPSGPNQFNDVNAKSIYAPGINAAAKAGIVHGTTAKTFSPKQNITREQMSLMMDRAMIYMKIERKTIPLTFKDNNMISSTASRTAIANMVAYKIVLGYPTNEFKPKAYAQRNQAAAFINRMLTVAENPEPEKNVYTIGEIGIDTVIRPTNKIYKSFKEAEQNFGNATNLVISYNDTIVKMNNGIVVAKAANGKETIVYTTDQFKNIKLGMAYGSEMEYVSSDENSIRVNVAGQEGYVKYSEAYLLPTTIDGFRTYYSVDDKRNIFLNIYDPISKKYLPSVFYGKAPDSLHPKVKYYSKDGVNYTDANGKLVASSYQYFNVLPFRTATNYSAGELEQIIQKKLASREALYKQSPNVYPQYKDATTKSKLNGLGKYFKEAESTYKLNALMLLAQAIHESDYGMSTKALKQNNLFGMLVFDGVSDAGKNYANPQDSITDIAVAVLNKNYIPASGGYANGANLGNKYRGVNVRYTTDPFWGQKIAGHLYSLDLDMGGKDFINNPNPYQLYKVVSPTAKVLNVREEPSDKANKLYTYTVMDSVIASLSSEKKADYTWHKILSDSNNEKYGYVAEGDQTEKYIEVLNIAK